MYRNQDKDGGQAPVRAAAVPEAQPINQTDLAQPQQPAEAKAPASSPTPAARQDVSSMAAGAGVAAAAAQRPPRANRRKLVLGAIVMLAAGTAGWFGYQYLTVGRFMVTTDDAYVQAYNTTLAAKVAGYLDSVPVTDNTYVHAGDVIATIDDGDYRLAVDSARGKVATQEATVARMAHQITAQEAAVEQARTQLVSAQAAARRMELELNRQNALVARDWSSRQSQEQAQANRDQAVAGVQGAQAAIDSATANVDVLKGQRQEAISTLDELKTALAKAERDLSFTVIRAPIDGVIGNRAVQTGDYVQTGQRLASLVPLEDVYVDRQLQGDAGRALAARTAGFDCGRRAARACDPRHGGKLLAGLRRGVLAAAAGQRDRQFHQDRAAAAGAHPGAARDRARGSAAPGHVGGGERGYQGERFRR